MYRAVIRSAVIATILSTVPPVAAKDAPKANYAVINEEVGLPVFPYDITDRPYEVLGEIKTSVRKATIFSKAPSQDKIYRELWERGQKMGADAVIKAQYGDAHVTALSWGASTATGVAIKFTGPAATEAAAPEVIPASESAPTAEPVENSPTPGPAAQQ